MDTVIQGNKVALSSQVAQTLKQRVRSRLYRSGMPLPSVRTLSREFGVSVGVVQRAIRQLEEDGIAKSQHGKGVLVEAEDRCERTAIIFGFIHPYQSFMSFYPWILEYVGEAFAERSNFAVVRSSKDDSALERSLAEHLIANGIKGLLLWPTSNDPNGTFFAELSKKTPVVLMDRMLSGAELPAVVHDLEAGGRELCEYLLNKLQKKRLLVLMDDLRIDAYESLGRGIQQGARALGRLADVTVVQLPITSQVIHNINRSNFQDVDHYCPYVERLLAEGNYDAVFCTQDEFLEYVMVDTGLMDRFPQVQLATMRGKGPNVRSRKYQTVGVVDLVCDFTAMIAQAAGLIQRWVLSRQSQKGLVQVKMELSLNKLEEK